MSSVGALGVCPANPDVVYIGGGEVAFRGNIIQGDGVYRTADGGTTWTHVGLRDSQAVARLRVHPTSCDTVYAAVFGPPYNEHQERGVFKSTDGGQTWRKTLFRDGKTGAVDLTLDAKNPQVLFASLWEAFRTPWSMSSGGPGSGLFKSSDGGETWTELTKNAGLPAGLWGKVGVSVSPVDGNRVYALDRERSRRRPLRQRRCRRHLAPDQRQPQHPAAGVLLLAPARRHQGQGHRLHPQRAVLQVDRRRQDARRRSACRTATTTICGSRRPTTSGWCRPTTAAPTCR